MTAKKNGRDSFSLSRPSYKANFGIVMFIWTSIAHMARSLGEAGIAEIPNARQRAIWFRSVRHRLENLANVRVDLHLHVCHQI
jgi:hypothetical protein